MENLTGECTYCGQVNVLPMGNYTQEEKDEKATELCNCDDAINERIIKNAHGKIKEIFLADCEEIGLNKLNDEQIKMLNAAAEDIVYDNALNVVVTFRGGIKATLKKNSKGEIEIQRMDTRATKEVCDDK